MKKFLMTTVVVSSFVASTAIAAHPHFTGFYAGVNGGYGVGSGKVNATGAGTDLTGFSVNNDAGVKGFRGGLQFGYGNQFENNFYLGGEVSGDYSNTEGKEVRNQTSGDILSFITKMRRKDSFGIALHAGGVMHSMLGYLKLGVETSRWNFNVSGQDNAGGSAVFGGATKTASSNKRLTGFVLGLGAATMLSEHIQLGGEWAYTFYGKSNNLTVSNAAGTETITTNFKPRVADFRVRLSYKW